MTAVYLLLRRHVDGVELEEVNLDESTEHGLPDLSGADVSISTSEVQDEQSEEWAATSIFYWPFAGWPFGSKIADLQKTDRAVAQLG